MTCQKQIILLSISTGSSVAVQIPKKIAQRGRQPELLVYVYVVDHQLIGKEPVGVKPLSWSKTSSVTLLWRSHVKQPILT